MIKSFRHSRLRAFYREGVTRGLPPAHLKRLRRILTTLDRSANAQVIGLRKFGIHPLKGPLRGLYAVRVSGNWRVTFRFEGGNVYDVDYTDYH